MFLVMRDSDSSVNGIAIVPDGMTEEEAVKVMYAAADKAREANPDEWTYGDVVTLLKQDGFTFAEPWNQWWDE